jgi:hypothetical protein
VGHNLSVAQQASQKQTEETQTRAGVRRDANQQAQHHQQQLHRTPNAAADTDTLAGLLPTGATITCRYTPGEPQADNQQRRMDKKCELEYMGLNRRIDFNWAARIKERSRVFGLAFSWLILGMVFFSMRK